MGTELKTTLVEEYSNEKPPSDGEIYRKIRQYASDGNLYGELRWKARLCSNSRRRFEALMKNSRLRHAFDRVLAIPGHRSAMRISMLHRIMAVKCDEVCAPQLVSAGSTDGRRRLPIISTMWRTFGPCW